MGDCVGGSAWRVNHKLFFTEYIRCKYAINETILAQFCPVKSR